MARFPQTEAEVAQLALVMVQGLLREGEQFPTPPAPATELQAQLDQYNTHLGAIIEAETGLRARHAAKDEAYERLVGSMKATIKVAEVAFRDQPERLSGIGWGTRREGIGLEVPGEVREFQVRAEGDSWIVFSWKAPTDGGVISAYKIQRRKREGGTWEDVATAVTTEHMVTNQPRGAEHEYRVVAVNKAGSGMPSATVSVVL